MTVVTITASNNNNNNNNSGIKRNDARAFPILDPCVARTPIIAAACTSTREHEYRSWPCTFTASTQDGGATAPHYL